MSAIANLLASEVNFWIVVAKGPQSLKRETAPCAFCAIARELCHNVPDLYINEKGKLFLIYILDSDTDTEMHIVGQLEL